MTSRERSRSWWRSISSAWWAVLHHLVGQAHEAEDLAQEVFLRVYQARKKYRARAKFSTWLFTIANNLASNALRNRQRKPVVPLAASDSGPLGPRPAERLARRSRRAAVGTDAHQRNG